MKLSVFNPVLGDMPFESAMQYLAQCGVDAVEIGCGGYPGKAHCDPALLLEDEGALSAFKRVLKKNGLEAELSQIYPDRETETATASYVGPVAGATLVRNAVISVLLAAVLMLAYIALRFDFASGLAAVIGLLHDVLIMIAFMVILRSVIQMNSSFIAAMLTIVGYSINNTIVIFDRIRENNKKPAYAGMKREEVVSISVRESLGRTINTTLTTLVTIVTLYILGVDTIREFSLPIIIGILAGAYSANMINGYVWAALEQMRLARKGQKKLKAKKA